MRKVQKQTKTVGLRYSRHPRTQTSCGTDILSGSLCGDSDRASTGVWQAKEAWLWYNYVFRILSWTISICLPSPLSAASFKLGVLFHSILSLYHSFSGSLAGRDRFPAWAACEGKPGLCGLRWVEFDWGIWILQQGEAECCISDVKATVYRSGQE